MLAAPCVTCQVNFDGYIIECGNRMPNISAQKRRPPTFERIGGNLCLDFVNTLDNRPSDQPKELLSHYVDLVRFCEEAGALTLSEANALIELSPSQPETARKVLERAIELREALHAVFTAIIEKRKVPMGAMAIVNVRIQDAASEARLLPVNGRFEWDLSFPPTLSRVLRPIARAAGELLASDQLPMVRTCLSPTCRWLFLDSSKNHRRRWCDMKSCGNRAKVRRFYARKKSA